MRAEKCKTQAHHSLNQGSWWFHPSQQPMTKHLYIIHPVFRKNPEPNPISQKNYPQRNQHNYNQNLFPFLNFLLKEMYFRLENRTQRLFLANLITQAQSYNQAYYDSQLSFFLHSLLCVMLNKSMTGYRKNSHLSLLLWVLHSAQMKSISRRGKFLWDQLTTFTWEEVSV